MPFIVVRRRVNRERETGSPDPPRRSPGIPHLVEHGRFAVRVHRLPEAVVTVRDELTLPRETFERLRLEHRLVGEVLEHLRFEHEETGIHISVGLRLLTEPLDNTLLTEIHDAETRQRADGRDGREPPVRAVETNEVADVDVGEAV